VQLEQQVEKFKMDKVVEAAKRDITVSNLEKDIAGVKMQAEHALQAHKAAETNWQRAETELKESIFLFIY
jgi:hypothetical protein